MRHLLKLTALALIGQLMISTTCRAQYAWQVVLDRADDTTDSYTPRVLSNFGEHCTAIVAAGVRGFEFLRSEDAGRTWRPQYHLADYGLPYPSFNYVNAIQQIDSANCVVVGDSGRILRSFDAGTTWERQSFPSPYSAPTLRGVHFHDPLNGIVTLADRPIITSDGGRNWVLGPYLGVGASSCHCYGPGRFAVLRATDGRIYRTSDSWQTMDSTLPIMDTAAHSADVRWAQWTEGDTIFASGFNLTDGVILRTTDAGVSWHRMSTPKGKVIMSMSRIVDDTIYAGRGDFAFNHMLVSVDRGATWTEDTVPVQHQGTLFPTDVICSIVRPEPGVVLAATQQVPRGVGQIIRGTVTSASVSTNVRIATSASSPNPASDNVTLWFSDKPEQIVVQDVLGRPVRSLNAGDGGPVTLNITSLPPGIYFATKGIERIRFVKR